jgi:hypothetical protein
MFERKSPRYENLPRSGLFSSRSNILPKERETPREKVLYEEEIKKVTPQKKVLFEKEVIQESPSERRRPTLRASRREIEPRKGFTLGKRPEEFRKSVFEKEREVSPTRKSVFIEREEEEYRPMRRREIKEEITREKIDRSTTVRREWSVKLENELIELGYAPISKIVVSRGKATEGRYIKARNKYGQFVYIELDTDGAVSVDGKEVTHLEREEATVTPFDVKLEAYKCAGKDICGVAFECKAVLFTKNQIEKALAQAEQRGREEERKAIINGERRITYKSFDNLNISLIEELDRLKEKNSK